MNFGSRILRFRCRTEPPHACTASAAVYFLFLHLNELAKWAKVMRRGPQSPRPCSECIDIVQLPSWKLCLESSRNRPFFFSLYLWKLDISAFVLASPFWVGSNGFHFSTTQRRSGTSSRVSLRYDGRSPAVQLREADTIFNKSLANLRSIRHRILFLSSEA